MAVFKAKLKNKTWHPWYCYWVQILKKYTYFPLLVYLFDYISTFLHKKSGHSGFVAEQLLSIWCVDIDHMTNWIIFDWLLVMDGKSAIIKSNLQIEILETPSVTNLNYFNNTDFIFAATGSIVNYIDFNEP